MRRVGLVLWLTALWLVLWRDLSVANVVSGALIAVTVLGLFRVRALTVGERHPRDHTVRPLALIRFVAWFAYKLLVSNVEVAREVVEPGDTIRSGIVAVPVIGHSDLVTTVVADAISLTPGTLTLEVRGDPPVLYVHAMHLRDIHRLRHDILVLQRLVVRAIGSQRAVRQVEIAFERERTRVPANDRTGGDPLAPGNTGKIRTDEMPR